MAGTIRERSPGHYELRAYNPATKRQVTRTFTASRNEKGSGIREARRELARLVTEVADGKFGGEKATLGYLLDEWLEHGESRGRSPATLHGYRSKIARIKAHPIAAKQVAKLTARDLDAFYGEMLAGGMSSATVQHYHRILRAALGQAERWEWITRNPARTVTPVTAARPAMHVPTVGQARALVLRATGTSSPDLGPILLFGMLTGMRRGEVCGVQWSDVDWPGRRITVRRSIWQVRSTWGVKDPKTHQVRTIALDDAAVALLAARRARAEEDAELACAGALPVDAYVWSAQVDGSAPRTPNSLTRAFHRLCRTMEAEGAAADPPRVESWPFRFHDLRHLSATEMVGQGMDPRTVASRLGHADPSVTLRVYAHALEERDRDAAEGLGRALALPG
ncbi:MAG TPA: site-specific integrase [Acidimicrobiales bacterium]|nr:site-specific integrase [Acidimicrobiales bacterium]